MKQEKVHLIGIGGIGVSALARYFLLEGASVSGSDLAHSEITRDLEKLGARIFIGEHKKSSIPKEATRVIHTPAIKPDNPEYREAKRKKIKLQSYPKAVGELTKSFNTITVSGSHGKSTTTALAAFVLEEGYFDPTVVIGTKVKEFGNSNFRPGKSHYLVLEADEWNKSFLNYSPTIAIVTNIDAEHLDTYQRVEEVEKTFAEYLSRVPAGGKIIANRDDPRLCRIAGKFKKKVVWYSLQDPEAETVRKILRVPGEHNVSNGLAALALGRVLGIPEVAILQGLSRFTGTWRRFEFRGILNPIRGAISNGASGAYVFDDYGHHPTEIVATIKAARSRFPFRRIWCVYQPHQYQRLNYLWDGFVTAFDLADRVCLLPVYDVAGRETKKAKQTVNSKKLAHALNERGKNACHFKNFAQARLHLKKTARPGDIILMMGAGDIYRLTPGLISRRDLSTTVLDGIIAFG